MEFWYYLVELLPFEWAESGSMYFFKNALLAVIIIAPLFAVLSTMIVAKNMSFFSDALGHGAFTGLVIGSLIGIFFPIFWAMVFSLLFSLGISIVRFKSNLAGDTIIGVFSSISVALGIVLSTMNGGSFSKLNTYLIGDILSISQNEIFALMAILLIVAIYWCYSINQLTTISLSSSIATSRGIDTQKQEIIFSAVIAVVVTLSISWVGLLVINSLLVLPGAIARNSSKNMRSYTLISILAALFSTVAGLILSYYLGSSSGATMVLVMSILFICSLYCGKN